MICEKCGAEMSLAERLTLNFTSSRLSGSRAFIVPKINRNAEKYICPECGDAVFSPEQPNKEE